MRAQDDPGSEPIGRVLRMAPKRVLVVEADGEPATLGTRCVTDRGEPAGVVRDVIGPVADPLLVVDLDRGPKGDGGGRTGEPSSLVGETLYAR